MGAAARHRNALIPDQSRQIKVILVTNCEQVSWGIRRGGLWEATCQRQIEAFDRNETNQAYGLINGCK